MCIAFPLHAIVAWQVANVVDTTGPPLETLFENFTYYVARMGSAVLLFNFCVYFMYCTHSRRAHNVPPILMNKYISFFRLYLMYAFIF